MMPAIHGPDRAQFEAIVDFAPDSVPLSPLSRRAEPEPVLIPRIKPTQASPLLVDSNRGLDHFYQALWASEKHEEGAVTHVVHYGDSPTTADLITGDIRSQLQQSFGDAGHGFILVAKPWAWYQHTDVQLSASGWQMSPASHFETHDGLFGLGGVSFTGSPEPGARSVRSPANRILKYGSCGSRAGERSQYRRMVASWAGWIPLPT